jgi:hypothetical protein
MVVGGVAVECTAFVRIWLCLPTCTWVCLVHLQYLVDYPLSPDLHIWQVYHTY